MISRYLAEALRRARYQVVDGGLYCGTVPGLVGVIASARTLEACREELADVIEEWLLVRVAQGLKIPRLGSAKVQVRRAS